MVIRHCHGPSSQPFRRVPPAGVGSKLHLVLYLHPSVPVLLAVTFSFLSLYLTGYHKLLQRNMANRPIANGNPEDASKDFKGDIKVNNRPPNKEQLERVADLPVLDVDRKSYTFKSLYADNENGPRRVLVVFIRHFFCGVRSSPLCQLPLDVR